MEKRCYGFTQASALTKIKPSFPTRALQFLPESLESQQAALRLYSHLGCWELSGRNRRKSRQKNQHAKRVIHGFCLCSTQDKGERCAKKTRSPIQSSVLLIQTPHTAIGARLETNLIWSLSDSPSSCSSSSSHRWS